MIRCYSSTQSVPSLSSGESEFYGGVKGTSVGLGQQSLAKDLGEVKDLEVCIDSSAAKAMSLRRGLGKARHIETQWLWVQYVHHAKRARMTKIDGALNTADLPTKHVDAATMWRCLREAGWEAKEGKSKLALKEAI